MPRSAQQRPFSVHLPLGGRRGKKGRRGARARPADAGNGDAGRSLVGAAEAERDRCGRRSPESVLAVVPDDRALCRHLPGPRRGRPDLVGARLRWMKLPCGVHGNRHEAR
jgi:hypothetical protein